MFNKIYDQLKSREYIYNRNPSANIILENKFDSGIYTFHLQQKDGYIVDCEVYSDSLNLKLIDRLKDTIKYNIPFNKNYSFLFSDESEVNEICSWLLNKITL